MSFEENVYLQVLTTLSCCRIFSLLSIIPRCFSLAVHNPSKKKKLFGFLVSFISLLEVELCIRAITQYVHFCAFTQQNIFEILKCCCSVAKFCLTLRSPMDCRAPGLPVTRYLLVFAQDHVYWIRDAIQPSHPLLLSSPSGLNFSPAMGDLPTSRVTKILELQHQSFQWVFRTDFF